MRCPNCGKSIFGTHSSCPKCGKRLGILSESLGKPRKIRKKLPLGPILVTIALLMNVAMLLALVSRFAKMDISLLFPTGTSGSTSTAPSPWTAASTPPNTNIELPTVPGTTRPTQPSQPPYEPVASHIPASHTISLQNVLVDSRLQLGVFYDGQQMALFDTQAETTHHQFSFDGGTAATLIKGDLYRIDENGCLPIASNVKEFRLSANGLSILYLVSASESDGPYLLYLYNESGHRLLSNIEKRWELSHMAISPDGSCPAYVLNDVLYYCTNSGDEFSPTYILPLQGEELLAISNDGSYIYTSTPIFGGKTKLNCYDAQGNKTILGGLDGGLSLRFNAYNTEVIFYSEDCTFLSVAGQAPELLSEGYLVPMVPAGANTILADASCLYIMLEDSIVTTPWIQAHNLCYPFHSFYGLAYSSADGSRNAWFISEGKKIRIVTDPMNTAQVDPSGQFIYYITDDGTLYYQHISQREDTRMFIAADVQMDHLTFEETGQYCYFFDFEGRTCCYDRITDEISYIVTPE